MAAILSSILNFLAKPPGDLIYHLVVSLALLFTGGNALIKLEKPQKGSQKHAFLIGVFILIFLQLGLFGLRSYNTEADFLSVNFYFVFERLTATLTIIWLIWAFFDDEQRYISTGSHILLSFTLVMLAVVSVFVRPRIIVASLFNPLSLDFLWQIIALLLVVLGLLLAIYIRPPQHKILVRILLLLAIGHFVQILLINEMAWFMGAVRLSQMIGLPWLISVVKSLSSKHTQVQSTAKPLSSKHTQVQTADKAFTSRLSKIKANLEKILSNLLAKVDSAKSASLGWINNLTQRFSRSKTQTKLPEVTTEGGDTEMTAEMITDTKPALVNLLLKINLSTTREEKYRAVVRALSLSVVSDVCFLVKIPEKTDKLHILTGYDLIREVLYTPDSLAKNDLPHIMDAWQAQHPLELSQELSRARDVRTLAALLNYHSVGNLFAYPLGLPNNPMAGGVIFLSPYTGKRWGDKTRQLMDEIKDTLAQILFLPEPEENEELTPNQTQLRLNVLSEQIDRLRKGLAEKEAQIQDHEITIKGLKAKYQIEKMESVTIIEQMKSRIAKLTAQVSRENDFDSRTEHLLNEIRQLTDEREQLRIALNRANNKIKDLQIESGQTGPIRLSLESQIISLDSIAANVRLRVASQVQRKNIVLEIHNPDGRQMIRTDPELLQTALFELLINAIQTSEHGGTIKLTQKLSLEMGMLIIQVTDFGEGLTQSEQTALFSAAYEDIPGIGDVQSIRNAIRAIRVLNGKIWLKSEKASFTTFRFQIPVRIID